MKIPILLLTGLSLSGCTGPDSPATFEASLDPAVPTDDVSIRFSPKAAAVPLEWVDGGLEGSFVLGHRDPVRVRLERSGTSEYLDVLKIDADRNGVFDGAADSGEILTTEPSEIRYKMWSSFEVNLTSGVRDSETGDIDPFPYPVSLWYVEDLREEQTEHALRFTRRGWMEGSVMLEEVEAHIRLSDSDLDGVITSMDDWALAEPDSMNNIYDIDHNRPGTRHAWVRERAYRLTGLSPDGRSAQLQYVDVGVTRAKEREDDDQLAVDRRAPHSGGSVAFRDDFAAAETAANEQGKHLFIDFETTWCGPCKTMEEWVYTADPVVAASESVISVKVDGDERPDLAERFEVAAYPTMILMAPGGDVQRKLVGYQGVEAMSAFLAH